ncbi:hypothetical protein BJV77DRAFT_84235 [Russula vinacea]|nr:hypothetical protein BJV77DRAFT_84235 [Russula vinacea]
MPHLRDFSVHADSPRYFTLLNQRLALPRGAKRRLELRTLAVAGWQRWQRWFAALLPIIEAPMVCNMFTCPAVPGRVPSACGPGHGHSLRRRRVILRGVLVREPDDHNGPAASYQSHLPLGWLVRHFGRNKARAQTRARGRFNAIALGAASVVLVEAVRTTASGRETGAACQRRQSAVRRMGRGRRAGCSTSITTDPVRVGRRCDDNRRTTPICGPNAEGIISRIVPSKAARNPAPAIVSVVPNTNANDDVPQSAVQVHDEKSLEGLITLLQGDAVQN